MWGKNGISKLILKYFFENKISENERVTALIPNNGTSSAVNRGQMVEKDKG